MNWKALFGWLNIEKQLDSKLFRDIVMRTTLLLIIVLLLSSNNVFGHIMVLPMFISIVLTFEYDSSSHTIFLCASSVYLFYLVFIVSAMMSTGIYSTEVTIHLENQKVTQVNDRTYDLDGTWYLIESDNYPDLYLMDNEELNVEGVYSRFGTILKTNDNYVEVNDIIDTINGKVDE